MKFSLLFCTYIFSFFYIIFLCILYFSKTRIDNFENRIYKKLLVANIIGIIIQIFCEFSSFYKLNFLNCILSKFLLIYFIYWLTLFLNYVFEISDLKVKYLRIILNLLFFLSILLVFIFPYNAYIDTSLGIYYTNGIDTKYTYFISILYTTIISIVTLLKKKIISKKKAIPIYLLIVFFIISGLIQFYHPELTIIVQIETLICFIMYFTIENPDMKMIEQIREARDQAERANRAKSDFLSSMSHEIRTPLNAIVGLSEDMQARGNCPDDMKDDLTDVVAASRTLLEIVGNIMDISKIESEKMEITNIPYKFKEEIESLARVTGSRIGDKPIEYKINIAEDIPYELIGDKGHIKEVINNLLSNSIKYTDKGFIELNARCINKGDKCLLIISVKDTGRGIKASDISKLFNKFERLEAEKNSTTEGTGLGLAITKKLVELMNGKINVESRYGVGSIFMVQIPQKISKLTKPLTEDELLNTVELDLKKKDLNYGDKRILIVDDNPLNIKVAKRNILPLGFMSIDEASNGQECLDKIRQGYKYDLILMDIMMPIMSGEIALAELKKIPDFNTPVIALTADAIAGAEEKYRSQGFTDYLSKPFTKDIIKLKVDSIFVNQIKEEKKELDNRWNDAPAAVFGIDSIDDLYKM